jgi:hypothetical protein
MVPRPFTESITHHASIPWPLRTDVVRRYVSRERVRALVVPSDLTTVFTGLAITFVIHDDQPVCQIHRMTVLVRATTVAVGTTWPGTTFASLPGPQRAWSSVVGPGPRISAEVWNWLGSQSTPASCHCRPAETERKGPDTAEFRCHWAQSSLTYSLSVIK